MNCNWPEWLGNAVRGRKEEVEKGRRQRKTIIIKWERKEEGWGGGRKGRGGGGARWENKLVYGGKKIIRALGDWTEEKEKFGFFSTLSKGEGWECGGGGAFMLSL